MKFIKYKDKYIDVSEMRVVIWGAGRNSRYICALLQLDDIMLVVDNNPELFGKTIVLYGKEYVITSASALKNIIAEECYILITSTLYKDEIIQQIYHEYGNKYLVCESENNMFLVYDNLETMMYTDPIICQKVHGGNISLLLPEYINKLKKLINRYICKNISKCIYIPIRQGFRISFIVKNIEFNLKYIVHFPTKMFREQYTPSDEKYIKEAYLSKVIALQNSGIVVYEDEEGFEIEHYADEKICWNKDSVRRVLNQIHSFHESGIELRVSRNPWERLKNKEVFLKNIGSYYPYELSEQINYSIEDEIENYNVKVCHGDFHYNNVVMFKNKYVIIDWEWIGMSDPIFDVCHFINSFTDDNGECIYKIEEGLYMYLMREPSRSELKHARAVLAFDTYLSYCSYLMSVQKKNIEFEEKIIKHIEEYQKD